MCSAAVDERNNVWLWGGGDEVSHDMSKREQRILSGKLSPPKWSYPQVITHLKDKDISQVSIGSKHGVALTKCGSVYVWNQNKVLMVRNIVNANKPYSLYTIFSHLFKFNPKEKRRA